MSLRLKNTYGAYGLSAQLLHWAVAVLVLGLLGLGLWMEDLPQSTEADIALKTWIYSLHKTLGVVVLGLVILRIIWAFMNPRPILLNNGRRLEAFVAEMVHWALYGGMLVLPLTGWLHHATHLGFAPIWWPFGQGLPFVPQSDYLSRIFGFLHWWAALTVMVSVTLHVAGAMKHAVVDRDGTLQRMIPGLWEDRRLDEVFPPRPILSFLAAGALFAVVLGFLIAQRELGRSGHDHDHNHSPSPNDDHGATSRDRASTVVSDAGVEAGWMVDPAASNLGIAVTQNGALVEGRFLDWNGIVRFDPARLDKAQADITVRMASIELGPISGPAREKDFLDTANHPEGRFMAERFKQSGDGRYLAESTVTVKGISQPVPFLFEARVAEGRLTLTGEVVLDRRAFGVGASVTDPKTLAFEVPVRVNLRAGR